MASVAEVIVSQYRASLRMLRQAIDQCPDALWGDAGYSNPFWQTAYHALFYTHLYLQPTEQAFVPWRKHQRAYSGLGGAPAQGEGAEPYSKEDVIEYYELCWQEVEKQLAALDLDAPSGFHWLPFNKLELQFYNIRHLQQHVGELYERLGASGETQVGWVASVPT